MPLKAYSFAHLVTLYHIRVGVKSEQSLGTVVDSSGQKVDQLTHIVRIGRAASRFTGTLISSCKILSTHWDARSSIMSSKQALTLEIYVAVNQPDVFALRVRKLEVDAGR